jgi:hypothetical protein
VACSQPGATCEIETWEHGCDCSCGSDGWWGCFGETIGSHCPSGPPDAGIDVPPDVILPDAAACSRVEAESIGSHPGWALLYGNLSGDLGLSALGGQVPLQFNFTGTTLAINHEIGPTGVPMDISIDGAAPVVIAGYQANNFDFVTSPVASGPANTEHHVSVVCEGNSCSIDYFDVTCL